MGETPTREMMGSRTFLFTILAVSCHGLPKMTGEVVPEAQTMLLQHTAAFTKMSPTGFISAVASSGGTEADCRTFATATTTDISTTVKSQQGLLDAVATGSSCAAMGQDAVAAATAVVTAAKAKLETAKTDAASKQSAEEAACSATFEVAPLSLGDFKSGVLPNVRCVDISNEAGYTAANAACTLATTISAAADQAVLAVKTKVTDAEAALASDVVEASRLKSGCLCRVHKAQTEAWASASEATAAHATDWKQAHEVACALDKTTTCTVPPCPTVTKPTVADGVANADSEHCTTAPTMSPTKSPTKTPTQYPTQAPTDAPCAYGVFTAVGTKNTNVCPAGSVTMATEADCRSAATAMGNNNFYVYSWHNFPKGCFQSEGAMYWNTNTRGGSHPSARPICGGANGNRCKNKPCSCSAIRSNKNGESGGMTHSQRTDAGAASCQSHSFPFNANINHYGMIYYCTEGPYV